MVDHLNDTNPTVRHAAKEWLNLAIKSIQCLVDPILGVLLHENTARKKDDKGDLIYLKDFDTNRIGDILRKVSLLLIIDPTLINSLCTSEISQYIKDKAGFHNIVSSNYLELFIDLSILYIKAQSPYQEIEISKVHSSAAEVLRLLSNKTPLIYIPKLLENIGEVMYKILGTKLESSLLGVLHQLFSYPISFEYPSKTADVLILGLRSKDLYLRDQ